MSVSLGQAGSDERDYLGYDKKKEILMSYTNDLVNFSVRVTGMGPILMHKPTLVDPLHPLKKEMSKLTSKRKKTDDDLYEIARLEWVSGLYTDEPNANEKRAWTGPYLPGRMFKAMLINAAKKSKEGPKAKSGLIVESTMNFLDYTGPKTKKELWEHGDFTDMRPEKVSQSKIMRCRPIFKEWACNVDLVFDKTILDKEDIIKFFEVGGRMLGLGDSRVGNGGDYGSFSIKEINGEN